jgi:hypothetical protein
LLSEAYVKVLSAVYQLLFSIFPSTIFSLQQFFPFPFSIFPSTILFPSIILFPSKIFPHQKAQSKSFFPIFKGKIPPKPKAKSQAKVQKPKVKPQKAKKKPLFLL